MWFIFNSGDDSGCSHVLYLKTQTLLLNRSTLQIINRCTFCFRNIHTVKHTHCKTYIFYSGNIKSDVFKFTSSNYMLISCPFWRWCKVIWEASDLHKADGSLGNVFCYVICILHINTHPITHSLNQQILTENYGQTCVWCVLGISQDKILLPVPIEYEQRNVRNVRGRNRILGTSYNDKKY